MLTPLFFFFDDTAPTEIYTLSLHDALPISGRCRVGVLRSHRRSRVDIACRKSTPAGPTRCRRRSEEHTSELQSHSDLVCRLLLEKKKAHMVHVTARADVNGVIRRRPDADKA